MKDLVIIVPYRNREEHLKKFIEIVPNFYEQKNITFDILICELDQQGDWNAGLCNNSVFSFLQNTKNEYKYIYIHHVDVYPISGNFIFPAENQCIFNIGDYGSCILSLNDFIKCNGYSNDYWGWGSEDNDFYNRLQLNNICLIDFSTIKDDKIVFDEKFQSHPRNFVGKNYANNIKLLYSKKYEFGLNNFYDCALVNNLTNIKKNVYKHLVVPKITSPKDSINKKALITYVENHIDFQYIQVMIKSGLLYAGYEYDIIVFLEESLRDTHIDLEIKSFGGNTVYHTKKYNSSHLSSIERWYAYKNYFDTNNFYDQILHVDASDVLFLKNPFIDVINDKINFVQEDILCKDEKWNIQALNMMHYDEKIVEFIENTVVTNGGIIFAPKHLLLKLVNSIINEFEQKNIVFYGIDQPIINKLIYYDKIFNDEEIHFKNTKDFYCINLHAPLSNKNYFGYSVNICTNLDDICKFSIIHQYNRDSDLNFKITEHFKKYFVPICT